jgi:Pilus formation protein N terminal region
MALWFGRPAFGRVQFAALAFGLAVLMTPSSVPAADIDIILDQAKLVKLPERVATIVIGNPLIADASVQSGGLMVITGKGYGTTNLIALDRSGAVLMERFIEVRGQQADETVVVYKGIERETYSCSPLCERRITLGDGNIFFNSTLSQTVTRNSQAQGMSSSRY